MRFNGRIVQIQNDLLGPRLSRLESEFLTMFLPLLSIFFSPPSRGFALYRIRAYHQEKNSLFPDLIQDTNGVASRSLVRGS